MSQETISVKPLFWNHAHVVEAVTPENTLTVPVARFFELCHANAAPLTAVDGGGGSVAFARKESDAQSNTSFSDCFLCDEHGLQRQPLCGQCFKFSEFPRSFLLHSASQCYYVIPPPSIFNVKNLNIFKAFLLAALNVHQHVENSAARAGRNGSTARKSSSSGGATVNVLRNRRLAKMFESQAKLPAGSKPRLNEKGLFAMEKIRYRHFITADFKGGSLAIIRSGKKSYVRNKILGKNVDGVRLTLTIDSSLLPDEISLPERVFAQLDLELPMGIVNRSPSINSRCIYVVKLCQHTENDNTVRINAFLLEGLHADQDGDELNVFFFRRRERADGHALACVRNELRDQSWAEGRRRDVFYRPRYEFSQYQKTLCSMFDEELRERSPLWRSLSSALRVDERLRRMMNLGCSTHRAELDHFLQLLSAVLRHNRSYAFGIHEEPSSRSGARAGNDLREWRNDHVLTVVDVSDFDDPQSFVRRHVVDSGAKGTPLHLEVFRAAMQEPVDNLSGTHERWFQEGVRKFDLIIESSADMSIIGSQQFVMLYEFSALYLRHGQLYKNEHLLQERFLDSDLGSWLCYNAVAAQSAWDALLQLQ